MTRPPLPEPDMPASPFFYPKSAATLADPGPMYPPMWGEAKMHAYADACVAQETAALREDRDEYKRIAQDHHASLSMCMPKLNVVSLERDALRERVRVLKGFSRYLESILVDLDECSCISDREETLSGLRAALKESP